MHGTHREGESRAYYDDFAAEYERERGHGYHRMLDDLELDVTRPLVQGRDVLEAGCGTGLILRELLPHARRACGFDLSPGMVSVAAQRGLDVVLGSVTDIPFADASFDVVCSFKVLAHVPDIERALRELARVTRPGGQLVLEFYNPWSLRYLAKRVAGPQRISASRTEADVYTRWDSPRAISAMLPDNLSLQALRGVRVVTPAAFVHRMPVIGPRIAHVERMALDSPLRFFGGFLVAILGKSR